MFTNGNKKTNTLSALLLCGFLFFTDAAQADVFFTTYGRGGEPSLMGSIGKSGSGYALKKTKTVQPESRVFGYNQGSRVLLVTRDSANEDRARILDPDDLAQTLADTRWPDTRGIGDAVYMRGYLYLACRESSNIVKINTNDHTRKEIAWTYPFRGLVPNVPPGYAALGVGVTRFGDEIYGLFTLSNAQGHPLNSVLVKLADDITSFRTLAYVEVSPDAAGLLAFGNALYVFSRGNGTDLKTSLIQKVTPSTMTVENVMSAHDLDPDGGRIEDFCLDGAGNAFIATHKPIDNGTQVKLFVLKGMRAKTAKNTLDAQGGVTYVCYDGVTNLFWASVSKSDASKDAVLCAFDSEGIKVASFGASELGDSPYAITAIKDLSEGGNNPNPTPRPDPDPSDSGGGCSAKGYGIWGSLALIALHQLVRRSEKTRNKVRM